MPGDFCHLINELAQLGILEIDGPAFFLLAGDGESRALACDNGTFREIVLLYLRSMRRDPDLKAQLLMLCLEGWEAQPEKNAVYMQQMKLILQSCLRSGDPFTQIGAGLYWVLLPGAVLGGLLGGLAPRK